MHRLVDRKTPQTTPIDLVSPSELTAFTKGLRKAHATWLRTIAYRAQDGELALVPKPDGSLDRVVLGVPSERSLWSFGALTRLPPGRYAVRTKLTADEADRVALGFSLGTYRFTKYKKPAERELPTLVWPEPADRARVQALCEGTFLGRDLVNTPAGDLGPSHLAEAAKELATRHKAKCKVIVGDELLGAGYPAVHAVGRACSDPPRLIDLTWGRPGAKKVTLVGKGVCFDTGGLDLKSPANMKLMKKDMGGAATVLGLAHAIMATKLDVRLRVLVPAVENSVAGNALHPMDVIATRKGLSVEVGDTDAEGRLILSDCLTEADGEDPELILDFATLTGAARVALGTDVPGFFTSHDELADELILAGRRERDPLWRLPLWDDYRPQLDSPVADLCNISSSPYGGAITAALFLREFVRRTTPWVHVDTMAWNETDRPGRPRGGEIMGLRAAFSLLHARYGRG